MLAASRAERQVLEAGAPERTLCAVPDEWIVVEADLLAYTLTLN